jgi:hypothetical protein
MRNVTLQKIVLAGAVLHGGFVLTVNAPDRVGERVFSKYCSDSISPVKLLLNAILLIIFVGTCFILLQF